MSATGRGAERIANDNYPTPAWCVRRMLERAPWGPIDGPHIHAGISNILEPCAGEGAIVRVLREAYPSAHIAATDVRPGLARTLHAAGADEAGSGSACDACTLPPQFACDLELTNPPYEVWHEIAWASQRHRCPTWLALLLRIGAISHLTKKHADGVTRTLQVPSLYVLPQRPAFVAASKCYAINEQGVRISGCGWREMAPIDAPRFAECPQCGGKVQRSTSDASEYAWFVWGPQTPRVVVLADTPLSERQS